MQIQRRISITIGILGLATVALGTFVAVPAGLRIKELRTSIIAERGKIDRRYALRNYVRTSLAEIEKTRVQLEGLHAVAVQEGDEIKFVKALENAATSTNVGLTIKLETVNQEDITSWERWVPISIEVSGKFPQVASFLNEIEHLPYYIILDNLLVTTPRVGGGAVRDGSVEALFSGTVYWQSATPPAALGLTGGLSQINESR